MKNWFLLILFALLPFTKATAEPENRYDLFAKILYPITSLFSPEDTGQNRGVDTRLSLLEMTDVPPAFAGSSLRVAIQYPDKCLIQGLLVAGSGTGTPAAITICRDGQKVWVHPAALAQQLIAKAGDLPKSKRENDARLNDFKLPFPQQQLAFLPALFTVRDTGWEPIDDEQCRLLDLKFIPELGKALKVSNWAARIAVDANRKPRKLTLARPGWRIAVNVDTLEFQPTLPAATWQPTANQVDDVLDLDARQCRILVEALEEKFLGL